MSRAITLRTLNSRGSPLPGVRYEVLDFDGSDCIGVIRRETSDNKAVVIHIPSEENTITVRASKGDWTETRTFDASKVQHDFVIGQENTVDGAETRITFWSFGVGIFFIILLLALSSANPNPSNAQRQIWQAVLSVACASFANGILGLLEVNVNIPRLGLSLRAIGAIAIAVIVFFFAPKFA